MKQKPITYIDLFAGCGGLSDGFEQTKQYQPLAFVEWSKIACKTLLGRLNSKWHCNFDYKQVINFDIQKTNELINGWNASPDYLGHPGLDSIIKGRVDLIIGGPPCQAYSIAGRVRDKDGMQNDYRNYLFESYVKLVNHFKPSFFIFENVEGILSAKPGGVSIVSRIEDAFKKINYSIPENLREIALINSADFGVPQIRKRVIILGINNMKFKGQTDKIFYAFYKEILPKYRESWITVKDSISDLPPIYPVKNPAKINSKKFGYIPSNPVVPNHLARYHSQRDKEIFSELATDTLNGRVKYPNAESLIHLYYKKTGKKSKFHKYHVLDFDKPSTTIPAHLYKDGLRHIHPDPKQARSITPREAGRLQTFDDDFIFEGSMGDQYKMIGNAVPPKLAKAIGFSVAELFRRFK